MLHGRQTIVRPEERQLPNVVAVVLHKERQQPQRRLRKSRELR
jgi:hypothetical protein